MKSSIASVAPVARAPKEAARRAKGRTPAQPVPQAGSEVSPIQVQIVRLLKLKRTAKEEGKAYQALEQEIWDASENRPGMKIDRRKLQRMAAEVPVTFTFNELQALDNYLAKQGLSLLNAFRRPTILESLASAKNRSCMFFLGSKPFEQFNFLSHWDARALAYILRGIERSGEGVQFDLEDIPLRPPGDFGAHPDALFAGETWRELIDRPDAPSLVTIGTPRAAHSSEIVLSRLFGVRPFNSEPKSSEEGASRRLPFYYVLPEKSYQEAPRSRFFRSIAEYKKRPAEAPNARWGMGGLDIEGEEVRWIHWDDPEFDEYAIIAAGRRREGQVWLYVGGASGPSTLAAARELEHLTETLPEGPLGEHSPVLWGVVKTRVRREKPRRKGEPGDLRRVGKREETQFTGPYIWRRESARTAASPGRPRKPGSRSA